MLLLEDILHVDARIDFSSFCLNALMCVLVLPQLMHFDISKSYICQQKCTLCRLPFQVYPWRSNRFFNPVV